MKKHKVDTTIFNTNMLNRVYNELDRRLRKAGATSFEVGQKLGASLLEREMKGISENVLSWETEQGYLENVDDLERKIREKLNLPEVINPVPKQQFDFSDSFEGPKGYSFDWGEPIAGLVLVEVARPEVRSLVARIRSEAWGHTEPLYSFKEMQMRAFGAAFEWLEALKEQDRTQVEAQGRSFTLDTSKEGTKWVNVEWNDSSGWGKPILTLPEGKLYQLWQKALFVADETFLTQVQAFRYIVIGLIQPEIVQRSVKQSGVKRFEVTLSFRGPVSKEAIVRAYRKALQSQRVAVVMLSRTQQALLTLFAQMPEATWKQRLEVWEKWCERNKKLTPFHTLRNGSRKANTEYLRAVSRASWQDD